MLTMAKVEATYKATATEIGISANGTNFLTIVGTHINGGYAAFVNFGIAVELAENDRCYNSEQIYKAFKDSNDTWLPKGDEEIKALAGELSDIITPLI